MCSEATIAKMPKTSRDMMRGTVFNEDPLDRPLNLAFEGTEIIPGMCFLLNLSSVQGFSQSIIINV